MAYSVDKIKEEAEATLGLYRGRPNRSHTKSLNVGQMRIYINKVLFLCREVKRLTKKLEKSNGKVNKQHSQN